jgi:hypothetical protein
VAVSWLVVGCGTGESPVLEGAAGESGRQLDDSSCISDVECSDGMFCNGAELCLPDDKSADDFGCVPSRRAPKCEDGVECTMDSCSNQ